MKVVFYAEYYYEPKITIFFVVKETSKFVTVKSNHNKEGQFRIPKETINKKTFNTLDAAKEWLSSECQKKIDSAIRKVDFYKSNLNAIIDMKESVSFNLQGEKNYVLH